MTTPATFPLPARPVRQARQPFIVANLFAIAVFAALATDLGAARGAWTVTALGGLDAVGNLLITTQLMRRIWRGSSAR